MLPVTFPDTRGVLDMKILCVCTSNTILSPMMAALMNAAAKRRGLPLSAESAGSTRRVKKDPQTQEDVLWHDPMDPLAAQALRDRGVELPMHETRCVRDMGTSALVSFEHILCLSDEAMHVTRLSLPASEHHRVHMVLTEHGDINMPKFGPLEEYIACAAEIEGEVERFLDTLEAE